MVHRLLDIKVHALRSRRIDQALTDRRLYLDDVKAVVERRVSLSPFLRDLWVIEGSDNRSNGVAGVVVLAGHSSSSSSRSSHSPPVRSSHFQTTPLAFA